MMNFSGPNFYFQALRFNWNPYTITTISLCVFMPISLNMKGIIFYEKYRWSQNQISSGARELKCAVENNEWQRMSYTEVRTQ